MSDTSTLNALSLSMGNRFFFYEWDNRPPLPDSEIIRSVANNHVIAANDQVRELIDNLRRGHLVHFRGYLVDATKAGEGSWLTSRRRDDRGNGACELFYVEFARAFEIPPEEFTASPALTSHPETTGPFAKAAAR